MSDQPPPPYGGVPPERGPYPGYPGAAHGYLRLPEDHGGATTAMVLGITSIAVAVIGLGCYGVISWVGAVVGPIAIVKARTALREIDAEPDRYKNRGLAVTGQITGIVGTVLGALALLGLIAIVAVIIVAAVSEA